MRPGGWVAVPRHVGRNYVPLLCGVDTDLRYYVIRDVIVLFTTCSHSWNALPEKVVCSKSTLQFKILWCRWIAIEHTY